LIKIESQSEIDQRSEMPMAIVRDGLALSHRGGRQNLPGA
jgi:hypothetical protein